MYVPNVDVVSSILCLSLLVSAIQLQRLKTVGTLNLNNFLNNLKKTRMSFKTRSYDKFVE
jgi:hypothetical protein